MLGKIQDNGALQEWSKEAEYDAMLLHLQSDGIDVDKAKTLLELYGDDIDNADKLTDEQKQHCKTYKQAIDAYNHDVELHSDEFGWKPVVKEPMPEFGEYGHSWPYHEDAGDYIAIKWHHIDYAPEAVKAAIAKLEAEIASTDYVITKTQEARLVGDPDPYENFAEIVTERKALRAKIAELEQYLPAEPVVQPSISN